MKPISRLELTIKRQVYSNFRVQNISSGIDVREYRLKVNKKKIKKSITCYKNNAGLMLILWLETIVPTTIHYLLITHCIRV